MTTWLIVIARNTSLARSNPITAERDTQLGYTVRLDHGDFATPRTAPEDTRVVAPQSCRQAMGLSGRKEDLVHVWSFDAGQGDRGQHQSVS